MIRLKKMCYRFVRDESAILDELLQEIDIWTKEV